MIRRMLSKNNPAALLCCAILLPPVSDASPDNSPGAAENYREARSALVSAYGAGDYKAMRAAARTAPVYAFTTWWIT